MWAVHPFRSELGGISSVSTVADLPEPPDAAFVAVNRSATVAAVRELRCLGAGAAVCLASGFAEVGDEGAALQAELVAAADGMPVIGPNCYGTVSGTTGAVLWPDQQGLRRCERGVAFVTQSGNIAVNLTMQQRALDVAHVLTLGNQADVSIEEALESLAANDSVTAVGLHIETLGDIKRFAAAVATARSRNVHVVALKTGSSVQGGAIAVSHTSSIVGSDAAYQALFDRIGVRRVHSIPELLDTLHVITTIGPLEGNRAVSLSCSGGEASLVADRAEDYDVTFPAFEAEHSDRIAATLNEFVDISNPLDYHTFIWNDEERLTRCFSEVLTGALDVAMLVLDFPRADLDHSRWWPTLNAFAAASSASGTPGIIASSMAEGMPIEVREAANKLGLAALGDIESTLQAIEAAAHLSRPVETEPIAVATRIAGSVSLSERDSKVLLAGAGIAVPNGELVSADAVAAAVGRIGLPVVIKANGPAHKSDVAGVAVSLTSDDGVAQATARLSLLSDELLVESHIGGGLAELLVNVRAEPPVGILLTLGAGGSMVEVLDDTVSLLLPTSREAVVDALQTLRIWPMLAGHRSSPAACVDAVADVIDRLGDLVGSDRGLVDIEINPLIVTENGAWAVDALISRGELDE